MYLRGAGFLRRRILAVGFFDLMKGGKTQDV